jgi:predicted acyl esterase
MDDGVRLAARLFPPGELPAPAVVDAIPYRSFADKPVEVLTQEVRERFAAELGERPAASAASPQPN